MAPQVSIVVVTWNIRDILERCLSSIDREADVPFELFVIDNYSSDATREWLRTWKPQSKLLTRYEVILNDKNLGYSGALNKGLRLAVGDYVLILNPDTRMLAPSLSKMVEVAVRHPDLGVLGFKVLSPNGKVQRSISRLPTFWRQIESRLGFYKSKFDYEQPAEVEQINAAVALVPKKVIDTIGLWDDGFFLWFEENDFCKRARAAGFKIYYSPEVSLVHESQAGIKKISFWRRQLIWEKSMFRYFKKHHCIMQAIAIAVLDPLCMFIGIVAKKLKNI